ncbi:MAG: hypothetical protein AB7T06_38685 [Kofleriaceae bacterium]
MRWTIPFLLAAGCVNTLEEHESRVGELERDCVIPIPEGVAALGAPVSIEFDDASIWIWESLSLSDDSTVANAAARITRDACARPPDLARDVAGIRSVLALSIEELASNATRTDGKRLALVPSGGFAHDGLGYLFYDHVLYGPGFFDAETLGTGLCVLDPKSANPCERIGDDTILWRPDRRVLNRGGVVVDDRALIAGCRKVASFDEPCIVNGVPIADVREPDAYQVWDAFHGWVDPMTDASELTNTIGSLTIAPFDGGFIATQLELFDNRVVVQLSDRAEQDYGHRITAFDVLPPTQWFVSGGREHASLRTDPRSIAVTYATDNPAAPGLHLVEFRFFEGIE